MALVAGPGIGGSRSSAGTLPAELTLVIDKHVKYIQGLDSRKDELDYWLTEHLRLNGVYWGLTALHLLGHPDALPRDKTLEFVLACQNQDGGFGAAPGHDSHMLYTGSAVQILATIDALTDLEVSQTGGKERIARYIAGLQDPTTGTFAGDEWGETDTRFLYIAFNALSILDMMHLVNVESAVSYIQACANFDGGFGRAPSAETHAGQIFTCLGALSIVRRLDLVDAERLGAWLSDRQLSNGGLNGRPEKLVDVCYSWWVLSSLAMLGKLHWIDAAKLITFILSCQDSEHGGISDMPGDMVDVFHTVFGVAGLSLLGYPGLVEVDPVYCMPKKITQALPYHQA
ncbi:geranylgeranyl transferase type-2 subunit beta [Capronia epimyces CBS 606.96]|uniref:Geranylgeranyl transferase type-2 subunit beta n=1 Tax=Capronia epimyces CBS 606.96 TaxID=1182542 RepID=W9XG26_9EURO|nr:geranylgeranyl transferase type-2 subunit beta [Capronia epimyces CBS 606.96]EXJ79193.1 geranylgeranyl transferase type-2 subunit beta [Capronia epimyces CBS 606.96]